MSQQSLDEIDIFERFISQYFQEVRSDSIIKKNPPEPDIYCESMEGTSLFFELVECVDNAIAKSNADSIKIKEGFSKRLEEFDSTNKNEFKRKFFDALIYVIFKGDITTQEKIKSIPRILGYLLLLEDNVSGSLFPQGLAVTQVMISRGDFDGPFFDSDEGGFFADEPCLNCIKNKFEKKYSRKEIELLVYYDLQPELHQEEWLPHVKEFVEKNIDHSNFKRVWVYSIRHSKVIFVYPHP